MTQSFTKSDLIKKLTQKNSKNLFAKDVILLVNTVFDEISNALQREQRIELRGFGSFSIRKRQPRKARNPKTNEVVHLGARNSIYFRAGKELRERLNKNLDNHDGSTGNTF